MSNQSPTCQTSEHKFSNSSYTHTHKKSEKGEKNKIWGEKLIKMHIWCQAPAQ